MISFNKNQLFVVTGASSGIGKGIALLLNELGATVVGIGRRTMRLQELKDVCMFPDNMYVEIKDLSENISDLPIYVKSLKESYGKFHGLVCAAGITDISPLQLIEYDKVKMLYDINYFSPLMMVKGIADKRNNIGKGTSIVCISSMAAYVSMRGMAVYSGAKSALSASMKSISREVAPYGIRVNCVSPADILTPMTLSLGEITESKKKLYPMGFGEVEDVANFVAFLLSDKAKWLTGNDYHIDGGSF